MKKSIITYVVVIALIVLLAFTAAFGLDLGFAKIPSVEDGVTLGLDLVGGSEITYEAQIPDGTPRKLPARSVPPQWWSSVHRIMTPTRAPA